jgi:hypothetical protein
MATPGFLSERVKKRPLTGLTTDRYEFLGLDQAEPDLGDPLVGPSSVGANPTPLVGTQYVLTAYQNQSGKRYWTAAANIIGSGLIPGSFTVFDNNVQVGAANSFNRFNFIGSNVSVDFVGAAATEQTGVATVRIVAKDLTAPGNLYSIPYHSNTGLLDGANDFVYVSGNVGVGSTQPTVKLDVIGGVKISGIVTASNFVGSLTGTATTANNLADAANITTGTISSSRLSGTYGISITGTATTATNLADAANITTGTISSSRLSGSYDISITGTATTATNVIGGITSVTNLTVGAGGTIITTSNTGLIGISTTNPLTPLQVETYGVKTGVGTFIASSGVSTSIDSFSVSSTDFKTAEYTVHIGFGTYIQAQKVLVMQNQNTSYSQEYAVMYNNSLIVSIGATISDENCILQVTPQSGVSGLTTYRFVRNTLL